MPEVLRQADLLQIHQVAEGYVVRQTSTGAVHHLNQTAALLLELCDGRATTDEILATVQRMFTLKPAQLRTVRSGLDTLRHTGLVIAQAAPAASRTKGATPRKKPAKARTRR